MVTMATPMVMINGDNDNPYLVVSKLGLSQEKIVQLHEYMAPH